MPYFLHTVLDFRNVPPVLASHRTTRERQESFQILLKVKTDFSKTREHNYQWVGANRGPPWSPPLSDCTLKNHSLEPSVQCKETLANLGRQQARRVAPNKTPLEFFISENRRGLAESPRKRWHPFPQSVVHPSSQDLSWTKVLALELSCKGLHQRVLLQKTQSLLQEMEGGPCKGGFYLVCL